MDNLNTAFLCWLCNIHAAEPDTWWLTRRSGMGTNVRQLFDMLLRDTEQDVFWFEVRVNNSTLCMHVVDSQQNLKDRQERNQPKQFRTNKKDFPFYAESYYIPVSLFVSLHQ